MAGLDGRRILIVEDSPVVGQYTVDILGELGCGAVGPAPNMAAARLLVEAERFDAAIMDVHIRGERVFPLCQLLASKDAPFLLTSGYGDWQVPEKWENRPRLLKPYKLEDLRAALGDLLGGSP